MLDNDHKPIKLAGLLLLAAIALIFLVIVWLIGSAFVQSKTPVNATSTNSSRVILNQSHMPSAKA